LGESNYAMWTGNLRRQWGKIIVRIVLSGTFPKIKNKKSYFAGVQFGQKLIYLDKQKIKIYNSYKCYKGKVNWKVIQEESLNEKIAFILSTDWIGILNIG
jgi:hypothetical protein